MHLGTTRESVQWKRKEYKTRTVPLRCIYRCRSLPLAVRALSFLGRVATVAMGNLFCFQTAMKRVELLLHLSSLSPSAHNHPFAKVPSFGVANFDSLPCRFSFLQLMHMCVLLPTPARKTDKNNFCPKACLDKRQSPQLWCSVSVCLVTGKCFLWKDILERGGRLPNLVSGCPSSGQVMAQFVSSLMKERGAHLLCSSC